MKPLIFILLLSLSGASYGLVFRNFYSGKVNEKYYLFKLSCYEEGALEKCYLNRAELDLNSCTLETSELVKDKVATLSKENYTFINSSICITRTIHANKKSLQVIGTLINKKDPCADVKGYDKVFKAVKYEDFAMSNHGCKDLKISL